jgi:hypothetical protein
MEEKLKNRAFAAGEILAAIFTAANLALGYLDYILGRSPLLLVAVGFLAFVMLVFFHIMRRNALLESSQQNIQIDGEPNPHDMKVKNGTVASIVNIPFSNNPKYLTAKDTLRG